MTTNQNFHRKTALIAGILFIIGTASGILSVLTSGPILDDPDYLNIIAANQNQVIIGAICVLTMGLSLAMVPVVMYPLLRKHNPVLALGGVVFRGALEGIIYIGMVISWLLLIVLSREYVAIGAEAAHYQTLGNILQESDDLMNIVLQIVFSTGGLMFYYQLFQTRLVPRWLSGWGLLACLPYLVWGFLAIFGLEVGILMVPLALLEMVLAVWLIAKGFVPEAFEELHA